MSDSKKSKVSRAAFDLARRFSRSGDAETNAAIRCDPSGWDEVPEDVREQVDYDRPLFNWPAPTGADNNVFVLDAMALDVLKRTGFVMEAASLSFVLEHMRPEGDEIAALFHRYLDFSLIEDSPEIAQIKILAAKAGLDPESVAQLRRAPVLNPLAHNCSRLSEEWAWLVENAGVRSPFGKNAAAQLAPSAIDALSSSWLLGLLEPPASPPPSADDPSLGNRAWFDKAFRLGWIQVDRLGESSVLSAPLPFAARISLLTYEIASKVGQGMDEELICKLAFRHASSVGVAGPAALASHAVDFFHGIVANDLSGKGSSLPPPKTEPALTTYLHALNPGVDLADSLWVWQAFRRVCPDEALMVEESWLHKDHPKLSKASKSASLEKIALQAQGLVFIVPAEGLSIAPAARLRSSLRL